jgi:hypothetical protein
LKFNLDYNNWGWDICGRSVGLEEGEEGVDAGVGSFLV